MENKDIIISDRVKLGEIKEKIIDDGPVKLHVVSDFDKTLTSCFVGGKKIVSLISILRDGHYLSSDYSQKAQALYDKYHPLEIDPNIPPEEKEKIMYEWWSFHYNLLAQSGLNKKDIKKAAETDKISFRPGALEFFDFLNKNEIPLLILSGSGLGEEVISLFLEEHKILYSNIFIVSNTFVWDKNENFIRVNEPIIHSLNKDYSSVKKFPFYKKIKERKNIVLLGDGVEDAKMVEGFDYDNIIKIGFLNENSQEQLTDFKNNYDVIILNDGSMDYVNVLLRELVITKI